MRERSNSFPRPARPFYVTTKKQAPPSGQDGSGRKFRSGRAQARSLTRKRDQIGGACPELPEVETTAAHGTLMRSAARSCGLAVHEPRLRWRLRKRCRGRSRPAYPRNRRRRQIPLFVLGLRKTLLLHLGMSGSPAGIARYDCRTPHDMLILVLDSGPILRFNDPRRLAASTTTSGPAHEHPLLNRLAPEPFDRRFNPHYLWSITRRRRHRPSSSC